MKSSEREEPIEFAQAQLPDEAPRVDRPRFRQALDWFENGDRDGRSAAYDAWCRGGFVWTMLWHRQREREPITVQVSTPGQMEWAYRRLMLLDRPILFVYAGETAGPAWVKSWVPIDGMMDGCFGYIGFWGTIVRDAQGRRYVPAMGYADLLPSSAVRWLTVRASDEFLKGRVLLAPAHQVGVVPSATPTTLGALSQFSGGPCVVGDPLAQLMFTLPLPYLDRMSIKQARTFLEDHGDQFVVLRQRMRDALSSSTSHAGIQNAARALEAEIAELNLAARHAETRRKLRIAGGSLSTVAFGGTVAQVVAAGALSAATGATLACGAAAALVAWLRSCKEDVLHLDRPGSVVLWNLGFGHPRTAKPRIRRLTSAPPPMPIPTEEVPAWHWLHPPGTGLLTAMAE